MRASTDLPAATATSARSRARAVPVRGRLLPRAAALVDGTVEWGVVAFAAWTLLYHLALVVGWRPSRVLAVWLVVAAAAAVLRVVLRHRLPRTGPRRGDGMALLVGLLVALLAWFVVRPDLDDASYVVRSTWVAQRDDLGTRDVLLTGGDWPGLAGQVPYLPSVETLIGALARLLHVNAGSLLYLAVVPLLSFASVWALWTLVRAWRARRAVPVLLLAVVVLLWGGALHASWGNLGFARIWQGKVMLVAVLVPLTFAWCARWWTARRGAPRTTLLVLVGAAGVAGVGLSPAGVFVLPEVVVVGAVVGLLTRRPARSVLLAAVGCAYPLLAGVATKLGSNISTGDPLPEVPATNPWVQALGTGAVAAVAAVAGMVVLAGLLPARSRMHGRVGPVTAAAAVVAGVVVGSPPAQQVLAGVMGTDSIAWRVIWVVPLPLVLGLLVAPARAARRPRLASAAVGTVAAAVLVVAGLPVWSPANGVTVTSRPVWKVDAGALESATTIVDVTPAGGRYLAPATVVAAVGTLTADLAPVGTRVDYLASYRSSQGDEAQTRLALQLWVEGTSPLGDPEVAGGLDALDVRTVCGAPSVGAQLSSGWQPVGAGSALRCWGRDG